MSRQQFGFVAGFLIAAVWAIAGFGAAAGALLAGLVGWLVVRVIDGDITVGGLADRASASRRQ
ncbi:hypothetical protein [Plantactinospora sonchi]|uniref:DUF2273 domain-containing protein n=1 Tax=Plantactinospora sonchi TaxID=1544735 RepID=A0ABU7S395_9ACTN